MALTITPANVRAGAAADDAVVRRVVAGQTVSPGKCLYKKLSDSEWYLTDANESEEAAGKEGVAIAISYAGDGQTVVVQTKGPYIAGATLVVGETYFVDAVAGTAGPEGGIAPSTDVATGWWVTPLGVAISTTELYLFPRAYGVVRA